MRPPRVRGAVPARTRRACTFLAGHAGPLPPRNGPGVMRARQERRTPGLKAVLPGRPFYSNRKARREGLFGLPGLHSYARTVRGIPKGGEKTAAEALSLRRWSFHPDPDRTLAGLIVPPGNS